MSNKKVVLMIIKAMRNTAKRKRKNTLLKKVNINLIVLMP